jgi:Zn-dependent metalloprotease
MKRVAILLLSALFVATTFGTADAANETASKGNKTAEVPNPGAAIGSGSSSSFITGDNLGTVPRSALNMFDENPSSSRVKVLAGGTLKSILKAHLGYSGEEIVKPAAQPIIVHEKLGTAHIRFRQELEDGLPLEGAAMLLHFRLDDGKVLAVNGEFHNQGSIQKKSSTKSMLACEEAVELALYELKLAGYGKGTPLAEWQGDCHPAAVQGMDGRPYYAYKRLFGYLPMQGGNEIADSTDTGTGKVTPSFLDMIFAERSTGRAVAVHPKLFPELQAGSVETYDCNESKPDWVTWPDYCELKANVSYHIQTGTPAIDELHNNLLDTYNFYEDLWGQRSYDGANRKIKALARIGDDNAYFSCSGYSHSECMLFFGGGDLVSTRHHGKRDVGK